MRSEKWLKDYVDDALKVSGGVMPLVLLAVDKEEWDAITALLKGRHGGKSITIRMARSPKEVRPVMDLVYERAGIVWEDTPLPPPKPPAVAPSKAKPKKPEPAPAVVDDLDYDGY